MSGETARYNNVAIALHWLIALAIILQLASGYFHEGLSGPDRRAVMSAHKSLGLTVLALSFLRLGWRLAHKPPPLPPGLKPWERTLSSAVHAGFYVVMIGAPLAGWAMSSSSPKARPIPFWGAEAPALPLPRNDDLAGAFASAHWAIGWLAVLLLALHVAGALKHRFVDGHDVLWRMIPFLKPR